MGNDVTVRVTAENDVKPGFDAARRDAASFGKDIEREGVSAGVKAGKGLASALNQQLKALHLEEIDIKATPADALRAIDLVDKQLRAINGDSATVEVKLQTERALGDLGKFRKQVDTSLASIATEVGPSVGKNFIKSISGSMAGASSTLGPALGAAAIGAAPIIASTVAAAVIGGAGIGGVAGGLILASKDPRVASAITSLGDGLQDRLEGAALSFVNPAIKGVGIIDDALSTIDVEGIFAKSSQFVLPLADGVGRAITAMGDGIEDLVDNAGPVINVIADGIGDIGEAVGEGLSSLADNGESAADTLDTLVGTIKLTTEAAFGLLNGAMEVKEFFDEFAGGVFAFDGGLKLLNKAFGSNEEVIGEWHDGVEDGADALTDFQKAMRNASDEILAQTDPLFGLMDAQQDVTEAQKNYNDALKKHGPRSREAKDAMADLGQAAFRMNDKVGDAAGGFNGKLSPAMRNALRNANLSESQIGRLERQLRDAAAAANAWEGTYRQTYLVTRKENISYAGNSITGGKASGGIQGAASGMNVDGLTWVGEAGPELLSLPTGSNVRSTGDSMRMAAAAGMGGGSGGDVYLTYVPSGNRGMDAFIVDEVLPRLQKTNRNRYGNSAERMLAG